MRPTLLSRNACLVIIVMLISQQGFSQPEVIDNVEAAKAQLSRLGGLIGEWRGTGQERRGSTKGAWREEGEFVWDFSTKQPAIKYVVAEGKHISECRVTWNAANSEFQMDLTTPEGTKRSFTGTWEKNKLELTSMPSDQEDAQRITITPLNEKRTLVLYEKSSANGKSFFRVGEVGYTRAGTRLAIPGGGQRECVVTGGTGTTPVTYKGETYYVCCSGCKQAFENDPEGIIAEFKARLVKKKAELNAQ